MRGGIRRSLLRGVVRLAAVALCVLVLVRIAQRLLAVDTLLSVGRVLFPVGLLALVGIFWALTLLEEHRSRRAAREAIESGPRPSRALRFEVRGADGEPIAEGRLEGAPFTVGRAPECAVHVALPFVSWHHGTLLWRGGRLYYRDEGSTAGSAIDGAACPPGAEQPLGPSGVVALAPGANGQSGLSLRIDARPAGEGEAS